MLEAPKVWLKDSLYRIHGYLVMRQYYDDKGPTARHQIGLAIVRWVLGRVQMYDVRHRPSLECEDCNTNSLICSNCYQIRRKYWG